MIIPMLDKNDFNKVVSSSKIPVFAKFFASWCGPCKMMAPIIEDLSKKLENQVKFVQIDIDICKDIAQDLGIMSIPTFIIFKDGEEIDKLIGVSDSERLEEFIKRNIES